MRIDQTTKKTKTKKTKEVEDKGGEKSRQE